MNKDIKEDWLEALRSGEYEQGYAWLEQDGMQCCLGVLCDIMDLGWKEVTFNNVALREYNFKPEGSSLTTFYGEGTGLTFQQADTLMRMNDQGFTFEEIADWIEVYL